MPDEDPEVLFYVDYGSRRVKVVECSTDHDVIQVVRVGDLLPTVDFLISIPTGIIATMKQERRMGLFVSGIEVVARELLVGLLEVEGASGNN